MRSSVKEALESNGKKSSGVDSFLPEKLIKRLRETGGYVVGREQESFSEEDKVKPEPGSYKTCDVLEEMKSDVVELKSVTGEIGDSIKVIEGDFLSRLKRKFGGSARDLDDLIAMAVDLGTNVTENFGLIACNTENAIENLTASRAERSFKIDNSNYEMGCLRSEVLYHEKTLSDFEDELKKKGEGDAGFYGSQELMEQTRMKIAECRSKIAEHSNLKNGRKISRADFGKDIDKHSEIRVHTVRIYNEAKCALEDFKDRAPYKMQIVQQGAAGRELREALNVIGGTSSTLEEKAVSGYEFLKNLTGSIRTSMPARYTRGVVRL